MSDISRTQASRVGSTYLTMDGTATGAILRAMVRTSDWSPIRTVIRRTNVGVEHQKQDVGGDSGLENMPVEIEIPTCPAVVYNGLRAQQRTIATLPDADIYLNETDEAAVERLLPFASLVWDSLTYKAAEPIQAGYYFGVVATLTGAS